MPKLTVLVSLITEDNDFQVEQAASAQAAAIKLDVNVQIIYANNDAVLQTQQILRFVQDPAKRPDAILVEPVGTGMPQVAKAAVSSGIAWGIVNTDVDYLPQLRLATDVPVFSVLSDHEQIGRIQGQQIAALLGETGCVLLIEGPARNVARMRTKGNDGCEARRSCGEESQGRLDSAERLSRNQVVAGIEYITQDERRHDCWSER